MFNLYIGNLNKHIKLENGYVLSAKLTTNIEEPLSLEIYIDIDELYRTESKVLVDYLIDENSIFYLDLDDDFLGYKMIKKRNQHDKLIMLASTGDKFITIGNDEFIKSTQYVIGGDYVQTIDGNSLILDKVDNPNIDNPTYETRIINSSTGSQNLLNEVENEELSIASQQLEDNVLKITLYSGLMSINYMKCNLVYGFKYKEVMLSSLLQQFLPNIDWIIEDDSLINYTVEAKQNLEILNDLCRGYTFVDNSYDFNTEVQSIKVYKTKNQKPTVRIVSVPNNGYNPYMFSVTENYPTISGKIELNGMYIREGTRCLVDYTNRHTRYRGEFMIKGLTLDLLQKNSEAGTVQFLRTDKDVRRSYLSQNLETLSNRLL
jgi:hypothetical protein